MSFIHTFIAALYKRTSFVLVLLCLCTSMNAKAFDHNTAYHGEDDTILVEGAPKTKFSYSRAIKSFSKHVLKFDIDALLSGGKNCTESVVRNFNDLADRTKYRLNLKEDRVEVKLTLNF